MSWLRLGAAVLALATVLAGCTGTTENVPPLLLAVGRQDPTNASAYQMVLVEDDFPNQPRLVLVPNSAVALPYAAVASDVVDRAGARTDMVVLTRDPNGGPAPASALVRLALTGIDPTAPTAFTAGTPLQLTGGVTPVFSGSAGPWCFSSVTVSRDGRYAFLIDDPNACAASPLVGAVVRLYQLDTSNGQVTQIAPSSPVQATAPLDDQADVKERLTYLVSGTGDAQVYQVDVPYAASQGAPTLLGTLPGTTQLALRSNGSELLAITNSQPYGTPVGASSSLEATALPVKGAGKSIATVDGARAMAADPTGLNPRVVVAGYQQSAVHASPTDTKFITTPTNYGLTGVAVAMDPLNNFGYVVGNGRIVLLDLLDAQQYGVSNAIPTTELTLPQDAGGRYLTAVAWARALIP